MSSPVRTRIAPSPTGLPHVGTIRNALYSWLLARHHGGQFVFRLEDTDRDRYDAASEQALADSFRWLGLDYDEGPDVGGPYAPYVQSQRLPEYLSVAERLIREGHAYRCYCSRERIQQTREARQKANIHPYGYDRQCRELSEAERRQLEASGAPSVVRFAVPLEGETSFQDEVRGTITYQNRELDDHVLLKSDGFPTYHLAHVVDDHLSEISHVVRSEEWLPSTPRHVLLYRALGWEAPKLIHPALIHGRDAQSGKVSKLSKRHGAVFVGEYREQGYLAEALTNFIALLGWSPGGDLEIMDREEMVRRFSIEGLNASPSVFDLEKLNWMNGVYIRKLSEEELVERTLPFLQKAGLVSASPSAHEQAYVGQVLKLEQERMKTLAEAPALTDFFFRDEPEYDPAAVEKRLRTPQARAVLETVIRQLEAAEQWDVESVEAAVRASIEELGVKPGEVIHPTRVAATARTVGPGLFETLWALGRERVAFRL
ncbi:MAG TPA: glutamate--tRNA ligase, partial [Armatimonadota bacterium]|nr:glutamate--tRNA ligase [Armatimonadota bacterium]